LCLLYPSLASCLYSHPVLTFSFYCYPHLRDLHSFPTRRSSDLCTNCSNAGIFARSLVNIMGSSPAWGFFSRCSATANCWARVLQDRKSTRLNSSHVSISYAVFCLKKKKTIQNGTPDAAAEELRR